MPTYLYCLRSDRVAPTNGLAGVDGSAVRAIDAAGLTAWVSDIGEKVSATVDRMKAHDGVCAAALDSGETPLPVRFGQIFSDDSAAISAVASREAALRARLARIAGCVEIRVVVTHGRQSAASGAMSDAGDPAAAMTGPSAFEPSGGPGTAFLKRRAREGRADLAREVGCEEVRHAVRTGATSLIVDQQPCESARGVAFFPVLVRRGSVEAFRSAVTETLPLKAIGLSVLGPFAPYSFAGDA
jgi:hypothetical protein